MRVAFWAMVIAFCAVVVSLSLKVHAQDPYKSGVDLIAEVEQKCAEGCIVFNREEAANLEEQLNDLLGRKQEEAFKAGIQYQQAACASLV